MKKTKFQHIGLIARIDTPEIIETLHATADYLQSQKINVSLETKSAKLMKKTNLPIASYEQLGKVCDLIIVIGGDGSLLHAARNIAPFDIPVIGINRGTLGFLTDIKPNEIDIKINEILNGKYKEEKRFLLETFVHTDDKKKFYGCALNEIVLISTYTARLFEFEIYIDNNFMCSERSNGIIIATPTGSTAYALSAGGPILHPHLDAIVLIPIFPHTLSNRPVVISGEHKITLAFSKEIKSRPGIHCDTQLLSNLNKGDLVHIHKMKQSLRLIHPDNYDYYETLRSKLGWGQRLSNKQPIK